MWSQLRSQIQTLLLSVSTIQEVSKAPKIRFAGYPAAHIVPSDNTGDYETNKENLRVYAFIVRILDETKQQGIDAAFTSLETTVDAVVDLFDQEDLKDSDHRTIGINVPTNYTYINVFATPNRWGEFADEEVIMAELTVKVQFSIDIS